MTISLSPSAPSGVTELILAEYREMPGLCLTERQMQRLWSLDADTCRAALLALLDAGLLRRTPRDGYMLVTFR
jgi:hypothetical protein